MSARVKVVLTVNFSLTFPVKNLSICGSRHRPTSQRKNPKSLSSRTGFRQS